MPPMRYWSGFATGFCVVMVGLLGLFALYFIPKQARMYQEFKGAVLPETTRLVLSPAWRWLVPGLGALGVLGLNLGGIKSPRPRAIGLVVLAVVLLFALLFTYWALYLPMNVLAGHIY